MSTESVHDCSSYLVLRHSCSFRIPGPHLPTWWCSAAQVLALGNTLRGRHETSLGLPATCSHLGVVQMWIVDTKSMPYLPSFFVIKLKNWKIAFYWTPPLRVSSDQNNSRYNPHLRWLERSKAQRKTRTGSESRFWERWALEFPGNYFETTLV